MISLEHVSVITPANDGESKTIVDICKRLNLDVRVSGQPWGATLDQESPKNLKDLRKIVIIVEMPSLKAEKELESLGHEIVIIDHHYYPKMGLDRRKPDSSLEQVARLFGYTLTRKEKGIAINDRDYIFGLLDAGYTIPEILEIRQFDLSAQGVPEENVRKVKEALGSAPVKNGITILRLDFVNAGYAQDFLVLENPNEVRSLLILGGKPLAKVQFYGPPEVVEKLSDLGEWMGGGGKTKFWGTNHPDLPEIFRRLQIDGFEIENGVPS
jgi:hypothetical protein